MRAGCKHTVSHRVVQRRRPDRCPVGLIEPTEHEEVLLSLTPEQTGGVAFTDGDLGLDIGQSALPRGIPSLLVRRRPVPRGRPFRLR